MDVRRRDRQRPSGRSLAAQVDTKADNLAIKFLCDIGLTPRWSGFFRDRGRRRSPSSTQRPSSMKLDRMLSSAAAVYCRGSTTSRRRKIVEEPKRSLSNSEGN